MARLEELLAQFNRVELGLDALETQLRAMASADSRAVDEMASVLRQSAQSGALSAAICARLIAAIEAQRFAAGDMTQSHTQVSPRSVPLPQAGGVQRVAPDATVQRAPPPVEKTSLIAGRHAAAPEQTAVIADRRPPTPDKTALISDRHPAAVEGTAIIADRHPSGAERTMAIAERHASNGEAEIDAALAANLSSSLATSLPADAAPSPVPGFLEPGYVIKERFLLKESIGRGGMGIVFSAVDRRKVEARDPNPMVALKILNTDFARHPKALMALQREARKAQTLAHPNVATVFDFDREGDAVFMTMELLRGRPLDQITREVRGRGMDPKQAWPIIRGIAEGLGYAHRKGIVHSDLKPGNIFILDDGHPKILDFGIARAVPTATASDEPKDIFDAGSLGAYTETYATAEMVDGVDPHPADDVYALGLISYELLTGAHPYQRYGALKARAMGLKPAALKGLTRRECRTLERAVSLDRADRPPDAAEFLKQLSGITKLQKNLIAASLALALAAGYFGYRSYQEAGPSIPFERLSTDAQEQFKAHMALGGESWAFYEREKNSVALLDAVDEFDAAYRLHPRNRQAAGALRQAADAVLQATKNDPEQQRAFARNLAERSDYLSKYEPVRDVAR